MKGLAGLILFVFVVSASFDLGSATKCYICSSNKGNGKDCETNVEKEFSAECIDPTSYCMTIVIKDVITRSCAIKNQCDGLESGASYCKVCNTDLCNTDSGGFVPGYSTSLVASFALFSFMKLFV
ncbi:uncharacterized protein LOC108903994 [Anoplophora glabripennis]|uniref:uncharacterized protein LOC108903994 n=1 Tax=Anoplophora glabripennis TaxID=217634 RepID=UPI0008736548|nr:uncharacterized protein LOC108903994 [Anoplophora glabripennis]